MFRVTGLNTFVSESSSLFPFKGNCFRSLAIKILFIIINFYRSAFKLLDTKFLVQGEDFSVQKVQKIFQPVALIFVAQEDLVVIGGGPGGYVAAIKAAQLGLKVP
jgi:hypothetical protein